MFGVDVGVPVFGLPGGGIVPGADGVVAVGLLLVGVWVSAVGAWAVVGLDGVG
ncbi:hypothetical protein [Nocardia alba]|uniref:hypothetical protein n=1 Tax=Nocardia alba TaxID=225051 RepID=UPI0012EEABD9|nr:hypothetical protein [Nocardia alba]